MKVRSVILLCSLTSIAFAYEGQRGHPRLIFTEADESRIKSLVRRDQTLDALIDRNTDIARRYMSSATVRRQLIGPRLLHQSRETVERVLALSMAYRLTGDHKFALRARDELIAAAHFSDWNPSHFLDVAEMTTALGIGYDWLYSFLGNSDRLTVRRAIIVKGLRPGLQLMAKNPHWITGRNNWTSVCMGGLTIGALAISDEEPQLADQVLAKTLRYFRTVPALYRPDGASPEGALYWHYAMSYQAAANSALHTSEYGQSVLGDPVFGRAGWFPIYMRGPTGLAYNFSDSWPKFYPSAAMFELARVHRQPFYAWWMRERIDELVSQRMQYWDDEYRFMPLAIAWYSDAGQNTGAPLDRLFKGVQPVFSMRGSWTDRNTSFIAAKGGDAGLPHAHQDAGSFVFDALGERWAVDLGPDDYNIPGYFAAKQKWEIFRLSSLSHNTIVIGGQKQVVAGRSDITAFEGGGANPFAIINMSPAYRGQARKVVRGIRFIGRQDVLIQDEVTDPDGEVRWGMATQAKVDVRGDVAILSQAGATLEARILAPGDARFTVEDMDPRSSRGRKNLGVQMLAVKAPRTNGIARIAVVLSPAGGARNPGTPPLIPLAQWSSRY
ncbi:MAG: heparinase II/III domain-containing protein [Fimbriimonadales bacterium]